MPLTLGGLPNALQAINTQRALSLPGRCSLAGVLE